jgi:chorismate dehydratase
VRRPCRLGAVSYLNVRPLVHGLDKSRDLVTLRFDVPSECARLLAAGEIDLGMVPSITYADRPFDRIVPGVCIGSDGPVASVALFTRTPVARIRRIALDTSSRTSAVLTRILCDCQFGISPELIAHPPDLAAMLTVADAALLIGDAALFLDPAAHEVTKIDLGDAWSRMTGLPFVWAMWSGPGDGANAAVVRRLQEAAEEGMGLTDTIAETYCATFPEWEGTAQRYLRENLAFHLDARAIAGLETYFSEAARLGLIAAVPELRFFDET